MSVLAIVLICVAAVVVALAAGGAVVAARRHRTRAGGLAARLTAVDAALAEAYAQDKGWERTGLEAAARREWEAQRPEEALRELALVEVVDRPGTEDDLAVFRVVGEREGGRLTLRRRDGTWQGGGFDPER
jgi:hypothetical protein